MFLPELGYQRIAKETSMDNASPLALRTDIKLVHIYRERERKITTKHEVDVLDRYIEYDRGTRFYLSYSSIIFSRYYLYLNLHLYINTYTSHNKYAFS